MTKTMFTKWPIDEVRDLHASGSTVLTELDGDVRYLERLHREAPGIWELEDVERKRDERRCVREYVEAARLELDARGVTP